MKLNKIDLMVQDVPAGTAFFRDVLGCAPVVEDARFAEFHIGEVVVMLSPDAMVPMGLGRGVILHVQVEDVQAALDRARANGATVLMEPAIMDWGEESALIAGPEEIVIDLYRPAG